ncbi:MAG: chorismate-binding protein, partial [Planctomycetota bacterium]
MDAATTIDRAHRAAGLNASGRALAVLVSRVESADALMRFRAAPSGERQLLSRGDDYLLGIGRCRHRDGQGPGRWLDLAAAAAAWRADTICGGDRDGPTLPLLLAGSFEAQGPGPGAWGHTLPGARLIVPRRCYWQRDGHCWQYDVIDVSADDDTSERLAALTAGPEPCPPRSPLPWPTAEPRPFTELVDDALALLQFGALRKVVLARAVDQACAVTPDATLAALRCHADPSAWLYAVDLDDGGCFLGASPELLFQLDGSHCAT